MAAGAASGVSWAVFGPVVGVLLAGGALLAVSAWRVIRRLREALRRAQALSQWRAEAAEHRASFELDAAGNVCSWNAGAQRLHGFEAEQILGRSYEQLFSSEERSARVAQDALERAAREGRHRLRGWRPQRSGGRRCLDTKIEALRDGAGKLTGFALSEQDITELVQREQELQQARESLAQAQRMAALGRLSDGIAHEFNNVVQVIITCVEALQRADGNEPQTGELLQMIRRNAEEAAGLSQRLLGLARRRGVNPAPTDVNAVVSEVVALLRQTLSEDIVVDLNVREGFAWAVIDRSDLEAALVNLAAAARDGMPKGGTLSVSTTDVLWPPSESGEPHGSSRHYVLISVSRIAQARRVPGSRWCAASRSARAGGWRSAPNRQAAPLRSSTCPARLRERFCLLHE